MMAGERFVQHSYESDIIPCIDTTPRFSTQHRLPQRNEETSRTKELLQQKNKETFLLKAY